MEYISNAFSLSMLAAGAASIDVTPSSATDVAAALGRGATSCVGHSDVAAMYSELLGTEIEMRRVSVNLSLGDILYVGQYVGPRLPQGTTVLPPGAIIKWCRVSLTG